MSAWTCCLQDGKAAAKIVPPRYRIPYWKGPGADSEEKHEPASDIDPVVVDGLKALDPKWPIREADIKRTAWQARFGHDESTHYFDAPGLKRLLARELCSSSRGPAPC